MEIRSAKPSDAMTLTAIAFAAKGHWGYPERWMEHWRDALTITPGFIVSHEIHVAVTDNRLIGFYALSPLEDILDLQHLWVLPDWMGRGVGRLLFFHALKRAKALHHGQLRIESDPNAEDFYFRVGARRVGINYYELDQKRRELPVLIYEIDRADQS